VTMGALGAAPRSVVRKKRPQATQGAATGRALGAPAFLIAYHADRVMRVSVQAGISATQRRKFAQIRDQYIHGSTA
jgi:hypothetical protein